MKSLKLVIFGMLLIFAGTSHAQLSVNVNVGAPPMWGPTGYSDVKYYYIPDVEAYYDVPSAKFIYLNGGTWVHRTSLPSRYRNYDLYHGYKVVMTDYRGKTPYSNFRDHKVKYAKGYHGESQKTYGERPDAKSYSKSNSKQNSNQGKNHGGGKENGHDNGKGNKK